MLTTKFFSAIYLFCLLFIRHNEQQQAIQNRLRELKHDYHACQKEEKKWKSLIRYKQKCYHQLDRNLNTSFNNIGIKNNIDIKNQASFLKTVYLSFNKLFVKDNLAKDTNYYKQEINRLQKQITLYKYQVLQMDADYKSRMEALGDMHELKDGLNTLSKTNKSKDSYRRLFKNKKQAYYLMKKMGIKQEDLMKRFPLKPLQDLLNNAQNSNRLLSAQLLQNPGMPLPAQIQTRARVQNHLPQNQQGLNPIEKQKLEDQFGKTIKSYQEIKDSLETIRLKHTRLAFKPNPYRGMAFKDRVQKNFSWQANPSNSYYPGMLDLSLGISYKISPKLTPQLAIVYKLGLGKDFNHINISSQGFGLRGGMNYLFYKSVLAFISFEQTLYKKPQTEMSNTYEPIPALITGIGSKGRVCIQVGYDWLQHTHPQKGPPWVVRFTASPP